MNDLDRQSAYWDSVAENKNFTHPIAMDLLGRLVPRDAPLLDYGCGYGRSCAELTAAGFTNLTGVDISSEMIRRGRRLYPNLKLQAIDGGRLPFPDETFCACLLLAVLTCIPTDRGQIDLLAELHRVLAPGGILYVSDYPLQADQRNRARYDRFQEVFGTRGIFRLSDGGVVRHHHMTWIYALLSKFAIIQEKRIPVPTMNGNAADVFQVVAGKKP